MSLAHDLRRALDPAAFFLDCSGFDPLDWQATYLRETRDTCLVKSRQIGASTAAAVRAVHVASYRPDSTVVVVSPTLKQSSEIVVKARAALRHLGAELRADSASLIALRNGSRIVSLPGTPRSVRGYSADLLILDEAAFIEPEVFAAARPLTIATRGTTIMQSTPAAASGDFHAVVTGEDDDWARMTVPATSVATIDPAWLERERRILPPDVFAAEYECTFRPAADLAGLFSESQIDSLFPKEPSSS